MPLNAKVSWGARVNSAMQDSMRATVVLAGVDSPFLVEELKPFGVIASRNTEAAEVAVAEETPNEEEKKGRLRRIFG